MASLFRTAFACPIPFRSPLLPLRSESTGEMPKIVCYYAEPLDDGRDILLTRYSKWLLPTLGVNDVETEELEVQSLEAAARFIQNEVCGTGLPPTAESDQHLQDSWDKAGNALTGHTVTMPPEFSFLDGIPLMNDALAQHDLMLQKHEGLQRIVKGRPVGDGIVDSAVVLRAQELHRRRDATQMQTPGLELPIAAQIKVGDWLHKQTQFGFGYKSDRGLGVSREDIVNDLRKNRGFRGIRLTSLWPFRSKPLPVAIFDHCYGNSVFTSKEILSEQSLRSFFDKYDSLSKTDQQSLKNKLKNRFGHYAIALNEFDQLRWRAGLELHLSAPTKPALTAPNRPQLPSVSQPRPSYGGGITEY